MPHLCLSPPVCSPVGTLMTVSACCAYSFVLLSVLSNLCLQLCAAVYIFFYPHVIGFVLYVSSPCLCVCVEIAFEDGSKSI